MKATLACFLSLAALGCDESAGTNGAVAKPSAEASARAPDPGASTATSAAAPRTVRCLNQQEIDADPVRARLGQPLAVVGVAPDDVLNLREEPGVEGKIVSSLAHDQRDVKATGKVCMIGNAAWYEVRAAGQHGWANGRFLWLTTNRTDQSKELAAMIASRPASAADLLSSLVDAIRDSQKNDEEPCEVRHLGIKRLDNGTARSVLHQSCRGDDSVAGQQVWLLIAPDAAGHWQIKSAERAYLCWRGSAGALCL